MSKENKECTFEVSLGGMEDEVIVNPCGTLNKFNSPKSTKSLFEHMDKTFISCKDPVFEIKFSNANNCSILELLNGTICTTNFASIEWTEEGFYYTQMLYEEYKHVQEEVLEFKRSYDCTGTTYHTWLEFYDTLGFVTLIPHRVVKQLKDVVRVVAEKVMSTKLKGKKLTELTDEANRFLSNFTYAVFSLSQYYEQFFAAHIATEIFMANDNLPKRREVSLIHTFDAWCSNYLEAVWAGNMSDAFATFHMWNQKNEYKGRDRKEMRLMSNAAMIMKYHLSSLEDKFTEDAYHKEKYAEVSVKRLMDVLSFFCLPLSSECLTITKQLEAIRIPTVEDQIFED